MDYEKKYKEALERFKTFREKYCTYGDLHFGDVIFDKTGEAQKALDATFPELQESEDERIRKGLIELIENWDYPQELFTTKRNIVAYLEKQKDIEDRWIEDRGQCFWDGVKEGKMLTEKQKEQKQPQVADASKMEPEVDLKKEYKEYVEDDPVFSILTNRNVGLAIARYFYELGLKARKEE